MKSGAGDYSLRLEYANSRGNREKLYNSGTYDPETQVMTGNWLFEEYNESGKVISKRERPLKLRQTFRTEMEYLLELTGYRILEVYGSYGKDAAKYPSWLIWVVKNEYDIYTWR